MGKRPIIGLLGVAWVGIALAFATGCGECCRNNTRPKDKYNPSPAWGKDTLPRTPPMIGEAKKDSGKPGDFNGSRSGDFTTAGGTGTPGGGVVTADKGFGAPTGVETNKGPAAGGPVTGGGFDTLPPGGGLPGGTPVSSGAGAPSLPPPPRTGSMTFGNGPPRAGTPGLRDDTVPGTGPGGQALPPIGATPPAGTSHRDTAPPSPPAGGVTGTPAPPPLPTGGTFPSSPPPQPPAATTGPALPPPGGTPPSPPPMPSGF